MAYSNGDLSQVQQNRKMQPINTALLRYMVHFYGNLGIQLHEYRPISPTGLFNLLQNLLLSVLSLYFIFSSPVLHGTNFKVFFLEHKPLFGIFFDLFVLSISPLLTALSKVHYLLYGPALLRLLNGPILCEAYKRTNATTVLILLLHTFHLAMFFVCLLTLFSIEQMYLLQRLFTLFSLYTLKTTRMFPFFAVHYLQFATYRTLLDLQHRLSDYSTAIEHQCIEQFIELAQTNDATYSLLSLQLVLHYFLATTNAVILIYVVFFLNKPITFLAFPAIHALYVLYLVSLNGRILNTVDAIVAVLQNRIWLLQSWSMDTRERARLAVQWQEIDIYRGHFEARMFHINAIDRPYLLATVLLIVNYIIFIYQTK